MFKKSQPSQGDIFSSISSNLSARKEKLLSDANSWHNVFYKEVVSQIDESIFSVLYSDGMGRPNGSIRVMLGMMILKEGHGWSDEQLFEQSRFNLKVLMALGYLNIDEDPPTESTYYLFRKLLSEYNNSTGQDLVKESFQRITRKQLENHQVSGKKIRIDSKLVNSNITLSTRVDTVLEAVRKFIKLVELKLIKKNLTEKDYEFLLELRSKTATNISYSLNKEEQQQLLVRLGLLIRQLLTSYKGAKNYSVLKRLYEDQYEEKNHDHDHDNDNNDHSLRVKPPKELDSSSVQSIHDPQATYRAKGKGKKKKHIAGYHANVVETCDESNEINLIIDVEVATANVSESDFLLPSITTSEELLKELRKEKEETTAKVIQHVTTDGGYDSQQNRKVLGGATDIHWNMGKAKGKPHRFHLTVDKTGNIKAFDNKENKDCQIEFSEKIQKYIIRYEDNNVKKRRYLTMQEMENYLLLQDILSGIKPEDKTLRANVESTIHQVFHRLLKRDKIKYRGMYKCSMYVVSRAIWANFRRITQKIALKTSNSLFYLKYRLSRSVVDVEKRTNRKWVFMLSLEI